MYYYPPMRLAAGQAVQAINPISHVYAVQGKAYANISPQNSFSAVSAHNQKHVSNAINEGNPEYNTTYIAGGNTTAQIRYAENNPYDAARKSLEESLLKGMYVDYVA